MVVFEKIGFIDPGILTSNELHAFKKYIVTQCTSTPTDINCLTKVVFEWNKTAYYDGYWRADYDVSPAGAIIKVRAIIVLNVFYLRNLEQLKRTFAHEYGHHWTLSYCAKNPNIDDLTEFRLPNEYYSKRGLNYQQYKPDYSIAWHFSDKEVIAEDYRVLFTPYTSNHRMVGPNTPNQLLEPSSAVADFIWNLAKPSGWM